MQTSSLVQMTKAVRSLLNDHANKSNGLEDDANMTERMDALQVSHKNHI